MITVRLSIQITRRKFVHVAVDPQGETLWVDRSIAKLLAWCAENDHFELRVEEADRVWFMTLSPLPR